jgi:hypothetical protein
MEVAEEGDGVRPALPVLLALVDGVGGLFILSYGLLIVDVTLVKKGRVCCWCKC